MQRPLKKRKRLNMTKTSLRRTQKKRIVKKRPVRTAVGANQWQKQISLSYNQGYDAGYDAAMLKAVQMQENIAQPSIDEAAKMHYEKGYKQGYYDGGDGIVDTNLPELSILPHYSIHDIVQTGVNQLRPAMLELLGAPEVAEMIIRSLDHASPLSLIRLGDGELLTLAQESVLSTEQIMKEGYFLNYAGVNIPDLEARDHLIEAIKSADIIGVPKQRTPNFQPLAFSVFQTYGIAYQELRLTLSTINYALYLERYWPKILAGRRILVVGNAAPGLAQVLSNHGIEVADTVSPVNGIKDVPRVMEQIYQKSFDIALISAGIPAVVIAQKTASQMGKVAIDFGHLADAMAKGEAPFE